MKYTHTTPVIDAIQFNGSNHQEVIDFTNGKAAIKEKNLRFLLALFTDQVEFCFPNDYVVKSPGDGYKIIPVEEFNRDYKPADPDFLQKMDDLQGKEPIITNSFKNLHYIHYMPSKTVFTFDPVKIKGVNFENIEPNVSISISNNILVISGPQKNTSPIKITFYPKKSTLIQKIKNKIRGLIKSEKPTVTKAPLTHSEPDIECIER